MSNSTLTHKQASIMFRMTGLKFWEPGQRPEPTVSQASDIIQACFTYLDTKENDDLRKVWKLVDPFFPDWEGAVKRPFFGGHKKPVKDSEAGARVPPLPGFDQGADRGADQGADRGADQGADRGADQGADRGADRGADQGADRGADQGADRGADQGADRGADQGADRGADQGADRGADQGADRGADQGADRGADQGADRGADQEKPVYDDETIKKLQVRIGAGLRNFWLAGPAGTGKTTLCRMLADSLGLPCTILSCSAGTSPAEITGFKYPEPRASAVSRAIGQPGVVVFDEMPMLEADVAAVCNALLANNEIETSTGHVVRDTMCIIIATANTFGSGADRVYCGNNQLDGATLNRFAGGVLSVDYSSAFESKYDSEVVNFCRRARSVILSHRLQRIVSTRDVIAGDLLKRAGVDTWKDDILSTWSTDEKCLVMRGGVL